MFEEVSRTFLKKSAHWTERLEALSKIRQLALAGAAEHDEFVANLVKLKDPILVQLKDLRSAIVREACTTVSEVAFSFKRHGSQKNHIAFISLATSMVDVCLKQAVVTIKVISKSAQECIKNIVESSDPYGSPQLLLRFVKGSQEKSSIVRHVSVEYIAIAINCWPSSVFVKRIEEVSGTIVRALDDADELVRKAARQCFWCFEKVFNEEGQDILDQLNPATKRRLMDAQGSSSSPVKSKKMSLPARFVAKAPHPQNQSEVPKRTQHLSLKRPVRIQQQAPKIDPSLRRNDYRPENYANAPETATTAQPVNRIHGAQRILHSSGSAVPLASHLGGAVRIGTQNRGKPQQALVSSSPSPSTNVEEERFQVARVAEQTVETEEPTDIRTLLLDTDSKVWSTRLEAFVKLNEIFRPLSKDGRKAALTKAVTSRLVTVFSERVGDPHYRVVQVAYSFFCLILEFIAHEVEQQLERVLPNILTKLSDPKSQIRKVSNELLQVCTRVFSHDLICSVLVGICKSKGDKLRLGALEYLAVLMPTSNHYFHHAHLKMLAVRVIPYLRSRKTVLREAATKVLIAAFRFNQKEILHILRYELSAEDRQYAVKFMSPEIGKLQELVDKAEKMEKAESITKTDHESEEPSVRQGDNDESSVKPDSTPIEQKPQDEPPPMQPKPRASSLPSAVDVSATLGELSLGDSPQKLQAMQQIERWISEKTLATDVWTTCGCQIVSTVLGKLKDPDVSRQFNQAMLLLDLNNWFVRLKFKKWRLRYFVL